jgi:CubicO group peptidase (beta-lactamase class C family)
MTFESEFPKAHAAYQNGVSKEQHFGMQIFVSHDGDVLLNEGVGLRGPNDRELNSDDLMLWMSASKPIAAIAIAQLMEQGKLSYDDPVCETIADFGMYGKSTVTIRHILMHTSCFPNVPMPFEVESWEDTIQLICEHPLEEGWEIGVTAAYHPRSSWFILGELIRRIDGRDYPQYVREEIFLTLGMDDCWIGMDPVRYPDYAERLGHTYNTAHGHCAALNIHSERSVTMCIPGGNGRGPVQQLARVYEMMLNAGELNGTRILKPDTVAELIQRHRVDLYDQTFMHKLDWGLGFIINSNRYGARTVPYGYGAHASEETFGHGGKETVSAYADPENKLVVIAAFNGMPSEPKHTARVRDFNIALYEDLNLD